MSTSDGLVARVEAYYDAAPRLAADTEQVGPFTLFVGRGPWSYYARPRLGSRDVVTEADVHRLIERQRQLDVPTEIEWQPGATPSLARACSDAGMTVHCFDVMVHAGPPPQAAPDVRMVGPDDDLTALLSAQQQGFGGSAVVDDSSVTQLRGLLAAGSTRAAAAPAGAAPVCIGMHNPVGQVSEVVGVATIPSRRREGWARKVTSTLVADASALGVETVFLSASTEAVARVYERVGFTTMGTVCAAELAGRTAR